MDLEIVSRSKLDALELAIRDSAHALYSGPFGKGRFLLSLECNVYPQNADAAIGRLCAAVECLGKSERRLWERALRRTFDVGYSLPQGEPAVRVGLRPATLAQVVAIGATVCFTCYPGEDDEPVGPDAVRDSVAAEARRRPSSDPHHTS